MKSPLKRCLAFIVLSDHRGEIYNIELDLAGCPCMTK
jgi:hypothetical protein